MNNIHWIIFLKSIISSNAFHITNPILSKKLYFPSKTINCQSNIKLFELPLDISFPSHIHLDKLYDISNIDFIHNSEFQSIALNTILAYLINKKKNKSLTNTGLLTSWILGFLLYDLGSFKIWSIMFIYFILGSVVTKIKIDEKEKLGIAEKNNGARGPENVAGSSLVGLICICLLFLNNNYYSVLDDKLLLIGYVGSIATKLGDTFSSEIGKAFGNNCFLITNFEPVKKGTEGAISIEGTLAGILGNIIIAYYSLSIDLIPYNSLLLIIISSFVATTIESYLGAIIQGKKKWISNEFINFINTLTGCILSIISYFILYF